MAEINESQYSELRRYVSGPGSNYSVITQVFEIGPLGLGRALRDVTTLSDTIHRHKLNIPDVPEVAVKLYFDSQEQPHLDILRDATIGQLSTWGVGIEAGDSPAESTTFTAYIVNPQIDSFGVDQDLVLSFTLKPQTLISDIYST